MKDRDGVIERVFGPKSVLTAFGRDTIGNRIAESVMALGARLGWLLRFPAIAESTPIWRVTNIFDIN